MDLAAREKNGSSSLPKVEEEPPQKILVGDANKKLDLLRANMPKLREEKKQLGKQEKSLSK